MQLQSRTLDKVQNTVTDMTYNSFGGSQLQTLTLVKRTKQVSEMLIFNLTLTWLISKRILLLFFIVKTSSLMSTCYS